MQEARELIEALEDIQTTVGEVKRLLHTFAGRQAIARAAVARITGEAASCRREKEEVGT